MKTRDRVYQAIVDHIDRTGMAPTIRELLLATGLASNSQAFFHLRNLEQEGRIIRQPFRARGIEVPGMPSTNTARDGASIARLVVADAQPTSAGYMIVSGDLIYQLQRWTELVGA